MSDVVLQEVITADVVHFNTQQRFDRVVSIEMFEHMKNYQVPSRVVIDDRGALHGLFMFSVYIHLVSHFMTSSAKQHEAHSYAAHASISL